MIVEAFQNLSPVVQALFATLFTWAVTAMGASIVFVAKDINKTLLNTMLGFTAGVMLAASFWSLLAPAVDLMAGTNIPAWFPATVGFLLGGLFLTGIDKILPHLHIGYPEEEAEGLKTTWRRSVLLVLAITLHNIPEGLAVGVAFGAVAAGMPAATLASAIVLAVGIGLQNFPEGLAVSMPLRREGFSPSKSFIYGQASGAVEPIAGVIGAAAVLVAQPLLPYALGFAAGAMIFVVVEEVIPESQRGGNQDVATLGVMLGFALMTFLDLTFS